MDGDKKLRVYNRCKYDIGVALTSGQKPNIKAGSFQLLSINDIFFIESNCQRRKFFSSRMLVPVSDDGCDLTLEDLGGYSDADATAHMDDEEILAGLKKNLKAFETWLDEIKDPEELHAVYLVARNMDLPASKLKILKAKAPNKDWLGEQEEE